MLRLLPKVLSPSEIVPCVATSSLLHVTTESGMKKRAFVPIAKLIVKIGRKHAHATSETLTRKSWKHFGCPNDKLRQGHHFILQITP